MWWSCAFAQFMSMPESSATSSILLWNSWSHSVVLIWHPPLLWTLNILSSALWNESLMSSVTHLHPPQHSWCEVDVMNSILLMHIISLHNATFLFCALNSFGIATITVFVVVGSCPVIFPLMCEMSFPHIFSAVSMSSSVTGQFLIWLLSMMNLKFFTVGTPMMSHSFHASFALSCCWFVHQIMLSSTIPSSCVCLFCIDAMNLGLNLWQWSPSLLCLNFIAPTSVCVWNDSPLRLSHCTPHLSANLAKLTIVIRPHLFCQTLHFTMIHCWTSAHVCPWWNWLLGFHWVS